MNIIYSCYWGGYLSAVAASLHTGVLNAKDFDFEKALELPMFNKIEHKDLGELYYIGQDVNGFKIYITSSKNSGKIIKNAIEGMVHIFDIPQTFFIDLNKYNNFFISSGLFLIKKTIFKKQGLKLIVTGIHRNLAQIEELVKEIKYNNK